MPSVIRPGRNKLNVLEWPPEKKLTTEIRKAINHARRAKRSTDFAILHPVDLPLTLKLADGEVVCAVIKNTQGRRFYFTPTSLYLETGDNFVRLPFSSVVAHFWRDDAPFPEAELDHIRHKQAYGDWIILHDSEGRRYELDRLGWAFQGMHNFFGWLARLRRMAV